MGIAELASKRSKDPDTQNGVCIINKDNRVVSVGYNGFPRGCSDDEFPWTRPEKYDYVIHAEQNAIINSTTPLKGCILYLYSENGYYPCNECAKLISQAGICEVVLKFVENENENYKRYKRDITKKIFSANGVNIRVLK